MAEQKSPSAEIGASWESQNQRPQCRATQRMWGADRTFPMLRAATLVMMFSCTSTCPPPLTLVTADSSSSRQ